jgi:hypothetical protein
MSLSLAYPSGEEGSLSYEDYPSSRRLEKGEGDHPSNQLSFIKMFDYVILLLSLIEKMKM